MGGCLRDAATAFDNIFVSLLPNEARELEHLLVEIEGSLERTEAAMFLSTGLEPDGAQVH